MHLQWTPVALYVQLLLISHLIKASMETERSEKSFASIIPEPSTIKPSFGPKDKENFTIGYLFTRADDEHMQLSDENDEFMAKIKELTLNKQNYSFFQRFRLFSERINIEKNISIMDILDLFRQADGTKRFEIMVIDPQMLKTHPPIMISYLMYLASYLGIPVLTHEGEGFGLEQKAMQYVMKMIPDLSYRISVIVSILQRYSWNLFTIVTTKGIGSYDFIQAIRAKMIKMQADFEMTLETILILQLDDDLYSNVDKLKTLYETKSRIFLFYCTGWDSNCNILFGTIFYAGLTDKSFMWVGDKMDQVKKEWYIYRNYVIPVLNVATVSLAVGAEFPFKNGYEFMYKSWELLVDGVEASLVNASQNETTNAASEFGEVIMRHWASLRFTPGTTGDLNIRKLVITGEWGVGGTWTQGNLQIYEDITWAGNALVPPTCLKENNLKVIFKEEPPFILMERINPVSGKCANKGVICHMRKEANDIINSSDRYEVSEDMCCSGFSIDLLNDFARDMNFTYDLFRVEDGNWGTEVNSHWNGLVAALIHKEADIALTSFTINSLRESVIDFSIPFMETKIAILVAKKSGTISAKAFLEPFDSISWIMILLVCIHAATFAIFLLEWMSPTGYNMSTQSHKANMLSMLHSYWLVWANLFGAAVSVNNPRSTSARFMTGVWALCALVFLGMYTANLTFFMATPEQHLQLSGIYDDKLKNTYTDAAMTPLRYGTVPSGHTDSIIRNYHPQMHRYMQQFNKSSAEEGLRAVMKGELDAFIYDATVLQYLVGQGEYCFRLKVEGGSVMSGYGIGFPNHSKHLADFNRHIVMYKDNGNLEKLRQVWFTETCQPGKSQLGSSQPLSVNQCIGAFMLLGLGMIFAMIFFLVEQLYVQYHKNGSIRFKAGSRSALVGVGNYQSRFNRKMKIGQTSLEQQMRNVRRRARKRNLRVKKIQYAWYAED